MEPEKERPRPRVPSQRPPTSARPPIQQKEFRKEPEIKPELQTIRKSYAQEVCVVVGFSFVIVGLLGFVIPYFLEAHLSYTHNVIHVLSGALALWFGFDSLGAAKKFCYIFGALYSILGLLGFVAGTSGIASVANPVEDRFLWRLIPEVLEFGTSDHIIHLLAGVALLLAAVLKFSVRAPSEQSI